MSHSMLEDCFYFRDLWLLKFQLVPRGSLLEFGRFCECCAQKTMRVQTNRKANGIQICCKCNYVCCTQNYCIQDPQTLDNSLFKIILPLFQSKRFSYLILFCGDRLEKYLKCFFLLNSKLLLSIAFLFSLSSPSSCTTAFPFKYFQFHLIFKSCVLSCSCYIWTAHLIYSPFW